jgi:hypothetical protein
MLAKRRTERLTNFDKLETISIKVIRGAIKKFVPLCKKKFIDLAGANKNVKKNHKKKVVIPKKKGTHNELVKVKDNGNMPIILKIKIIIKDDKKKRVNFLRNKNSKVE